MAIAIVESELRMNPGSAPLIFQWNISRCKEHLGVVSIIVKLRRERRWSKLGFCQSLVLLSLNALARVRGQATVSIGGLDLFALANIQTLIKSI